MADITDIFGPRRVAEYLTEKDARKAVKEEVVYDFPTAESILVRINDRESRARHLAERIIDKIHTSMPCMISCSKEENELYEFYNIERSLQKAGYNCNWQFNNLVVHARMDSTDFYSAGLFKRLIISSDLDKPVQTLFNRFTQSIARRINEAIEDILFRETASFIEFDMEEYQFLQRADSKILTRLTERGLVYSFQTKDAGSPRRGCRMSIGFHQSTIGRIFC